MPCQRTLEPQSPVCLTTVSALYHAQSQCTALATGTAGGGGLWHSAVAHARAPTRVCNVDMAYNQIHQTFKKKHLNRCSCWSSAEVERLFTIHADKIIQKPHMNSKEVQQEHCTMT